MPNSRRQSAVESQPNPSSNPKTSPTPYQPSTPAARLESSINRKFNSLGTASSAINASNPSRNSISRAAVSSDPKSLPKHESHNDIHSGTLNQPEATIRPKPSSLNASKKQNRAAAGRGLPSSNTSSIPTKRNLTTSDIPPTINHKKNKPESGATSKKEKNGSTPANATLRCHQCRAEVPLENVIMCTNATCARTIPRKRRSEPNNNPTTSATSSTSSAQIPAFLQGPCRISFCGRCLSARYGENLKNLRPTVTSPYQWDCPVCQDYCNCSICRKKKGLPPTGKLTRAASEAGFTSARELLAANPHAQAPDILNQDTKKNEPSSSGPSQPKAKTDAPSKKPSKMKTPSSSSTPKLRKLVNKSVTKKTSHKRKTSGQDPKHLEAVKKLKRKHQIGKPKAQASGPSSSKQTPTSTKPASVPLVNGHKANEPSAGETNKVPGRRAPHVVQAPTSYSCMPTGILGSGQILKRLHVREFVCRFKDLIPGLGATEAKTLKAETQRAEKIIDSMDDIVNFWVDDEGGMRAIMNGLARLIESDFNLDNQSTEHGSPVLKSTQSPAILAQLKRESKHSVTPVPSHQSSVPCWHTAINLLKEEGLGPLFDKDTENPYISPLDGSPTNEHNDERLQRIKFPPVQKLAIISGLIDIALRGHTLCEDLMQGLERERQAKSDILKERVKLNKKWSETKAHKLSGMPPKKSLLASDDGQLIQKPSKTLMDQESARIQALVEWEADMSQAESAHKNEVRMSFIDQYKVESWNRLRFQSIGQDPRNNSYYILSSTPGVTYPSDPIELAYSWSYSLIIHGSEPKNSIVKGKKKSHGQQKAQGTTTTTTKAHDSPLEARPDEREDPQIDMLEGGQRAPNDQWIRISEPKEIRQLASWIEYEAKLMDFKQNSIISQTSSTTGASKKLPTSNSNTTNHHGSSLSTVGSDPCSKSVLNLVDHIHRFSEFLDSKIHQRVDDRRALKSRHHS